MIAVATAMLVGCAWRDETPDNNGENGVLHLGATGARWHGDIEKTGFCGMDPVVPDPSCSCAIDGVVVAPIRRSLDWTITRRVWVETGNGLGDSTQHHDDIPLHTNEVELVIEPAVNLREPFPCDGGLRLMLDVSEPQELSITATIGEYSDRWTVHAVGMCADLPGCSF